MRIRTASFLACALAVMLHGGPASANHPAQIGTSVWTGEFAHEDAAFTEAQARRRTTTRVGPRGNVTRRTVVRPGVRPVRPGPWVRPGYRWRPGGAIAAGAALGFVAAGTAAAWAGPAPARGMCWYYTDRSRRNGFWDYCPR